MRGIILALAVLVISSTSTQAQLVTIKKVELAGALVIVHYDLEDSNPNNEYLLNLYASKDNFVAALTKVKGDVGMDIKPGSGKKMEWNILEEYGGYKGKLSLEIRGKVYVPFVRILSFGTGKGHKRGGTYDLTWKAGNTNLINIELYKGGQRVSGEVNQSNNGRHALFIPGHAKPGKDYRLKITDTKNPDEVVYSDYFKVTPKIPLLLKAGLPAVAAVAVIVILLNGDGTTEPPGSENPTEIEVPGLPGT